MATTSDDKDEIRELIARYCLAFDQGDVPTWVACYRDDGELLGAGQPLKGRQALGDFLAGQPPNDFHRLTGNFVIDVDGDAARCQSSVAILSGGAIISSGRVVDELQRVDGRWQIARRNFQPDAKHG
jgi:ketosteroid isomerase-like protein